MKNIITMGDPAGIGPEIILKAFQSKKLNYKNNIVYGDLSVLQRCDSFLKTKLEFNLITSVSKQKLTNNKINLLDFGNYDYELNGFGKPTKKSGKASLDYIVAAVDDINNGFADSLTTCPINKDAIHKAGCSFPGHTELLGYLTNCDDFGMMLAGKYLRVLLVTTHIAIKDVSKKISSKNILRMIELANISLIKDFDIKKPRIAVLGLNPHNGEEGLFGDEERAKIIPAIKKAQLKKINVQGPFVPDTFFPKVKGNFDCVICMYHDQGLIPLKFLAFDCGVNITLGLPIVRTSVDHGTAYDIVNKNVANPLSLVNAVKTALKISRCRKKAL